MLNEPRDETKPDFSPTACPWKLSEAAVILVLAVMISILPQLGFSGRAFGRGLISYLLQCAAFFLLPLADVGLRHQGRPEWLGFRPGSWLGRLKLGLIFGLLLLFGSLAVSALVSWILPEQLIRTQDVVLMLGKAANAFELLLLVLFIVVLSPIAEEMLFRAFLYPPLLTALGRKWGILASGAVFGAIHMNLAGFLPLALCGLILTWLYDRYQDIGLNILAHALLNGLTMVIFFTSGGA